MPSGEVQETGESDTFEISMPDSDDFEVMSGADGDDDDDYDDYDDDDDDYDDDYDSFDGDDDDDDDDDDEGYDVFYGVDGEETANPVSEAKAVVQQLNDAELTKAVQVVKTVKADPSAEQGSILASLGTDSGMADKIARLLNDIKVLKKQPDWKAMYEQEKANSKQGRGTLRRKWKGMGKGLGRLALSNKSCTELFQAYAKNKRLRKGARERFVAKCERKKNKLIERGVGRKKFGKGRRPRKFRGGGIKGKGGRGDAQMMDSRPRGRGVRITRDNTYRGVRRGGRPMSIRDKRKKLVRAIARKTGVKKGDIKNCLRHPHTCQKNAGRKAKQRIRTFVSSKPKLKKLFGRLRRRRR